MDSWITLTMLQVLWWLCFVLGWLLAASLVVLGINLTVHKLLGRLGVWAAYLDFLYYWWSRHQGKHWYCAIAGDKPKEREVRDE